MKIKKGNKVKKKKDPEPIEDPKDKLPKAYMDFSDDEEKNCAKLPKIDPEDKEEFVEPDTSEKMEPEMAKIGPEIVPEPDPALKAVLAAKAMIESQLPAEEPQGKNSFEIFRNF